MRALDIKKNLRHTVISRRKIQRQHGTTLVEALITVSLFTMLFGAAVAVLLSSSDSWQVNSVMAELRQELRKSVEWMKMDPDNNPADLPPRALVLNLSARLRAFHRGLAAAHMIELRGERTATGNIKARPDRRARGRRERKAAKGRVKRK